jgi:FkbM family methyltransferase
MLPERGVLRTGHVYSARGDSLACIYQDHPGGRVVSNRSALFAPKKMPSTVSIAHLRKLHELQQLIPKDHVDYLVRIKIEGTWPAVIYDVGANVLQWTRVARRVWPRASYFAFEALQEVAALYVEENIPHFIGVLSHQDGGAVKFYVSPEHPSGSSYYKENPAINRAASEYFLESDARDMRATTLDTAVREKGWPAPDLIKMDIQGAEMDVLKGAQECLSSCKDLIIELQKVEYNKGAPLRQEVTAYLESIGFTLKKGPFCDNGFDGDYHFVRNAHL